MGRDKALVPLAGKTMIEHMLDRLAGLGDETLVTTNHPENYRHLGVRLASDPVPGAGALHGLRTALQAANGGTVLLLACDMPFVNRALLEYLLGRAGEADAVVPRRQGEYEPLHAVYARRCLPAVLSALDAGERRLISFFPEIRLLTIEDADLVRFDPQGRSFFNVNTPEDLSLAEKMMVK